MGTKTYHIGGMDCAGCAHEVETGVSKLPGVQTVQVNFSTAKMRLDGDVPFLSRVAIDFEILDTDRHYHIPLLLSRYACSSYRGS